MNLQCAISALVPLAALVYLNLNCLGGGFVWDNVVHFLDSWDVMTRTSAAPSPATTPRRRRE